MKPPRPYLMLALAVLALAAAVGIVWQVAALFRHGGGADGGMRWTAPGVVTHADYFEVGERNVLSVLERNTTAGTGISAATAAAAERAVVRVRISYDFHDNTFSTDSATGALVQRGQYVATVAHEVEPSLRRPDARVQIVLCDGRAFTGERQTLRHYAAEDTSTDWCLIKIDDPPADLPAFELGELADGEFLVLGFPGRYGRDLEEHVTLDDPSRTSQLCPLRILCRARDGDPAHLELLAGCVPMGGISGAPCVDVHGKLVSIQRGIAETQKDGGLAVTLNVVPVDGLKSALRDLSSAK